MKQVQSEANSCPSKWAVGSANAIYNYNIREETREDSDGETYIMYVYDSLILSKDEYNSISSGTFPGEYNEEFRRMERAALLDEADRMKAKAEDYVSYGTKDEKAIYKTYLAEIVAYKMAIRDTVNQESFPASVTYPEPPEKPSV